MTANSIVTVYVDVSETAVNKLKTGIQRVVREVVRHSDVVGKGLGIEVVPVVAKGKHFYSLTDLTPLLNLSSLSTQIAETDSSTPRSFVIGTAKRILRTVPFAHRLAVKMLLIFRKSPVDTYRSSQPIRIENGDVLLLLDSFWSNGDVIKAAAKFRKRAGTVFTVIYDVIPILYPQYCDDWVKAVFANAYVKALSVSNGIVAISNAVADEVKAIAPKKNEVVQSAVTVGYFHLGADFAARTIIEKVSDNKWPESLWDGAPVFLMVGTIEPRKGHAFVLDAFEERWREGSTDKLLILGKIGWKTDDLIKRITNSPFCGSQLFMLNQVTDTELAEAYQRAYACIMASYAEGFGLPLIEALQHGVPVIASDIPVFREIAGGDAEFFSLGDIASFNKAVDTLQHNYQATKEKLKSYKWLTWKQSTEQLLCKILELRQQLKRI